MSMSEVENLLAEAAEKIRKDAFMEGWRAAIATMSKAISEASPEGAGALLDAIPEIARATNGAAAGNSTGALPIVGTTPHYVFQAVRKRPGMTGAEVIAAVRADGHDAGEGPIRTTLSRLSARRLIVNRHKKWFAT